MAPGTKRKNSSSTPTKKRVRNDVPSTSAASSDHNIVLKDYQEEALVQMQRIENDSLNLSVVDSQGEPIVNRSVKYEVGTLQMKMGSGKTFVVLEYIRRHLLADPSSFYLVIVPHLLIGQWEKEAHRFFPTFFRDYCLVVRSKKGFVSIPDYARVFIVNAPLLDFKTAGMWGFGSFRMWSDEIHQQFKTLNYKTIFMDEKVYEKFLTEPCWDRDCPNNNTNTNRYIRYRSVFPTNFTWLISATEVLVPRKTCEDSLGLSGGGSIMCKKSIVNDVLVNNTTSTYETLVKEYVRSYKSHCLVQTGVDSLFDLLTLSGQKDYMNAKILSLTDDIERKEREIEGKEAELDHLVSAPTPIVGLKKHMENIVASVDFLKSKIDMDRKLIDVLKYKEADACPICLDYFCDEQIKMFLPCCKSSVHNECLIRWVQSSGYTCPLCRNKDFERLVNEHKVLAAASGCSENNKEEYLSFAVEFKKLIKELVGKSVIVYENNSNDPVLSGDRVKSEIESQFSRPPLAIGGNNFMIENTVRKFATDPNENFLLLKSTFNYGLNLDFADNIVFLTQVNDQIAYKQILGRLLRLGRTKVLKKFIFKPCQ